MASYTTNLNLKKPAGSENVAIGDINNNMDTIDQAYGTLSNQMATKDIGTHSTIANVETALNSQLGNMNNFECKTVVFTYTGSESGYTQSVYVGNLYKLGTSRAWIIVSTAFSNTVLVGTRNTSWTWTKVSTQAM